MRVGRMRRYLGIALGLALVACSGDGNRRVLPIDVTGDQTYSGVTLRLHAAGAAGGSIDKTFGVATFGPGLL